MIPIEVMPLGRLATLAFGSLVLTSVMAQRTAPREPTETSTAIARTGRVAVVGDPEDEVTRRLASELSFLGFTPVLVESSVDLDTTDIGALVRAHDVVAVLAVELAAQRTRVWIASPDASEPVARVLPLPSTTDPPRDIAVRSIEFLRTSLIATETETHTAPEPDDPPPPPPRPRPDRLAVSASAAVGGAPGGLSVLGHVQARVRYAFRPGVGLVLRGMAPLHARTVRADEGEARVLTGTLGVGPWVSLRTPVVRPDLSLSLGPALVGMRGRAATGFRSANALVLDLAIEAAAGLEVVVSPRVRVRFEASATTCARTVRVRFAGRPVAAWCRPHAAGSLGLEVVVW